MKLNIIFTVVQSCRHAGCLTEIQKTTDRHIVWDLGAVTEGNRLRLFPENNLFSYFRTHRSDLWVSKMCWQQNLEGMNDCFERRYRVQKECLSQYERVSARVCARALESVTSQSLSALLLRLRCLLPCDWFNLLRRSRAFFSPTQRDFLYNTALLSWYVRTELVGNR